LSVYIVYRARVHYNKREGKENKRKLKIKENKGKEERKKVVYWNAGSLCRSC